MSGESPVIKATSRLLVPDDFRYLNIIVGNPEDAHEADSRGILTERPHYGVFETHGQKVVDILGMVLVLADDARRPNAELYFDLDRCRKRFKGEQQTLSNTSFLRSTVAAFGDAVIELQKLNPKRGLSATALELGTFDLSLASELFSRAGFIHRGVEISLQDRRLQSAVRMTYEPEEAKLA
jgi:hypothetical protein